MQSYQNSQVDRFVSQLPQPGSTGQESPQVPFRSSLELDFERERELVELCLKNIDELETALGRGGHSGLANGTGNALGTVTDDEKFFQKRRRLTNRFEQNVKDRVQPGTIYEMSNLSASLSSRITMQMAAKANGIFFPSEDWFSAYPVGAGDADLALSIRDHARWKVKEQTTVRRDLRKGVEGAFVRGETVMKSTYRVRDQLFRKRGMVLIGADGSEVRDAKGEVIFDDAAWEPQVVDQGDGQMVETGLMVLSSDRVTPRPQFPLYAERLVEMKRNLQSSPETEPVNFEDFLCSESAKSVDEADFICHLYDMPVMDVATMLLNGEAFSDSTGSGETRNAINLINGMASSSLDYESADKRARQYRGEIQSAAGRAGEGNPQTQWCECYVRYDADGDGSAEEIMVMIDRKLRLPVFYDYTANVTWDGKRPFNVIRGVAIEGRWYGMGSMELFSPEQEVTDLFLNRKNYRMSSKGRVTFWDPSKTLEGQADPTLRLNDGETYRLAPGSRPDEALSYVELPDNLNDTEGLIQLWMQLMQLKSGVTHAGDQNMSGLPATKLATGINAIEKSGEELFTMWIEGLDEGITASMKGTIGLIYYNMDEAEVFEYFEGTERAFSKLSPDQVRGLSINVQLKMSRDSTDLILTRADRASMLIDRFYALPPEAQEAARQGYTESLRELKWPDAENALSPIQPPVDESAQLAESLI